MSQWWESGWSLETHWVQGTDWEHLLLPHLHFTAAVLLYPRKPKLEQTSRAPSKTLKERNTGTSRDSDAIRLWRPSWGYTSHSILYSQCLAIELMSGCGCRVREWRVCSLCLSDGGEHKALCTSWQSTLPLPCPPPLWVTAHLFHPGCGTKLGDRITALNHSTLRMAPVGLTGSSACLSVSAENTQTTSD